MNEHDYQNDLMRAKYMQKCDEQNERFWMGYILGLHRGHDGDNFQCPHFELMNVPSNCMDKGLLQKSQGYKAGLKAFESGIPYTECVSTREN